eukprot:TRINITY_DN26440_c0_g1_i4.p1 TRINITY_DN26440_c0_g1~~TRINITY_DN26440_c0_g1_i4.p1  ORF type:complete len:600 (+),score=132.49 TRINITY_DN26440_c0_g1_i4:153-1952(+)
MPAPPKPAPINGVTVPAPPVAARLRCYLRPTAASCSYSQHAGGGGQQHGQSAAPPGASAKVGGVLGQGKKLAQLQVAVGPLDGGGFAKALRGDIAIEEMSALDVDLADMEEDMQHPIGFLSKPVAETPRLGRHAERETLSPTRPAHGGRPKAYSRPSASTRSGPTPSTLLPRLPTVTARPYELPPPQQNVACICRDAVMLASQGKSCEDQDFARWRYEKTASEGRRGREQAVEWRQREERRLQQDRERLRDGENEIVDMSDDKEHARRDGTRKTTFWKASWNNMFSSLASVTVDQRIDALRTLERHRQRTIQRQQERLEYEAKWEALSEEDRQRYQHVFDHYDVNENGVLDTAELQGALMDLGLIGWTRKERRAIVGVCQLHVRRHLRWLESLAEIGEEAEELGGGGDEEAAGCDLVELVGGIVPRIHERLTKLRKQRLKQRLEEISLLGTSNEAQILNLLIELWPMDDSAQPIWPTADSVNTLEDLKSQCQSLARSFSIGNLTIDSLAHSMSTINEQWIAASSELERTIQEKYDLTEDDFRTYRRELVELDRTYRRLDGDNSGTLRQNELSIMLREMGVWADTFSGPQTAFAIEEPRH